MSRPLPAVPAPSEPLAADVSALEAAGLAEARARLSVRLAGFEGPLDLMLDLARQEKLDLRSISILALADQYLEFVETAETLKLELAGDYLVMATWLTYLKSRLILPEKEEGDAPKAAELAEELANRLRRLEAVRRLGEKLGEMLAANAETLPRGTVEVPIAEKRPAWEVALGDLLSAFAERTAARLTQNYRIAERTAMSIPEAREALERMLGARQGWCRLEALVAAIAKPDERRTACASAFAAALELARDGRIALRQEAPFAPLLLRRASGAEA